MKKRTLELIQGLRLSLGRGKRWLLLLVLAVLLAPPSARAVGISDILVLFKTITSTIQGAIGGALTGIQMLNSTINNFRQQSIWPLAQINQAKAFVTSSRAQYGGLMFQIQAIRNNSATLTNPSQLESVFRNAHSGSIGQFQPLYTNVYGNVPSATDARPVQRDMVDMDDALRRVHSRPRSFQTKPHRECWRSPILSSNKARQPLPARRRCSRLKQESHNLSRRHI